ncbi:MAG: hypothetical protein L0Z53_09785 [Acidobacteriales bacterium]|nr:hypothetical protein [Terriglobales bacterium]
MLIEKIRRGVLQITTDAGTHYVQPSLFEKLQLLWTFRNFSVLPEKVLTDHERQFIGQLCEQRQLEKSSLRDFAKASCVIGTVDRVSPAPKKLVKSSREPERRCSA